MYSQAKFYNNSLNLEKQRNHVKTDLSFKFPINYCLDIYSFQGPTVVSLKGLLMEPSVRIHFRAKLLMNIVNAFCQTQFTVCNVC